MIIRESRDISLKLVLSSSRFVLSRSKNERNRKEHEGGGIPLPSTSERLDAELSRRKGVQPFSQPCIIRVRFLQGQLTFSSHLVNTFLLTIKSFFGRNLFRFSIKEWLNLLSTISFILTLTKNKPIYQNNQPDVMAHSSVSSTTTLPDQLIANPSLTASVQPATTQKKGMCGSNFINIYMVSN